MTPERTVHWLDTLSWPFIYGGLLMVVLGIATGHAHLLAAWSLGVAGSLLAAAGTVLLWQRSRVVTRPSIHRNESDE
jgi:hypothetical protein